MFSKLMAFKITQAIDFSQIDENLASQAFVPCGGLRAESFGWVQPVDWDSALFQDIDGTIRIRALKQRKPVPPSALNDRVKELKAEHVDRYESEPTRHDLIAMKETALAELTPRALPVSKVIDGYITGTHIVINTGSTGEAEAFLNCLRASLGSLSVVPFSCRESADNAMTRWLLGMSPPKNFVIGEAFDLVDRSVGSKATFREISPGEDEANKLLAAGMVCVKTEMCHRQRLRFAIDHSLYFTGVKNLDLADIDDDLDQYQQYRVETMIMVAGVDFLLADVAAALGGELGTTQIPDMALAS